MSKQIKRNNRNKNSNRMNNSNRIINSSITPNQIFSTSFPREMKATLKYFEPQHYTSIIGVAYDTQFNLNSIHDPNRSGVGHRPQGYNQWSAFYNRYRVDSVHVTVTGLADTVNGCVYSILPNNDPTGISDIYKASESAISLTKVYAYGSVPVILSKKYNLAIVNGVTNEVYRTDDRYQAAFGSSPTEILVLHVITYDIPLASITTDYTILLEYNVTMSDPIQIASS